MGHRCVSTFINNRDWTLLGMLFCTVDKYN